MAASTIEQEKQKKFKSGTEDSEDESEILEESPCGRWLKRREEVSLVIFGRLRSQFTAARTQTLTVRSFLAGSTERRAGHRRCLPGHGHRGRRGGGVERGPLLGAQELQSSGGKDQAGV